MTMTMRQREKWTAWGSVLAIVALLLIMGSIAAFAQTPAPVTPGYQVCSIADPGNTHCSFIPASVASPLPVQSSYLYNNITGQTTTTVKATAGYLHTVCINTPAATETITIYDNTAGSGTKIGTATVFASTNPCLIYDVAFATGLTIVTATASSDITVSYR